MQKFAVPASFSISDDASMADTVFDYESNNPSLVLFRKASADGWGEITAGEFAKQVAAVAKGLIASGVKPGDRVAVLSSTRFEWVLLDYAIWTAGGCTVAIYETSSPDQAQWILEDSRSVLLLVETPELAAVHKSVTDAAPALTEVLQIAGTPKAIDELVKRGEAISDDDLHTRRHTVRADSPATLIYTSGTTGRPKGVQLTHRNFQFEVKSAMAAMGDIMVPGRATLMFLPMAHVFARAVSIGAFESKVIVGHTSDIANILTAFAQFKPDYILSVPRVFEKVYNSAKQKAHDGGKGKIFDKAADTAIEWSRALDTGDAGLGLKIKHALFDRLVYSKLRAALGGNCQDAVSGGAPLGERLAHFFRGVGIPVYEGYGLTETTAAITVNVPGHQKIGTVGRPVPGCSVAIAEDGEILLQGGVVFSGYWQNEAATAEAIRDGWFHTGDLGSIDSEGYLSITGRKKEIIVTAGGKNVAPAVLEDTVRAHPLVSQCLVVGDKQPFIAALITLDPEALPGWKERHSLPASATIADLIKNPDLIAEIDHAIKDANTKVSAAEAIKKYRILEVDFTVDGGELTPTLKLKRNVIHQEFAKEITGLYASVEAPA
ncbi:MAG: AMP-dependent synthetase/ligase [Mycobacteriaceae bacterium]